MPTQRNVGVTKLILTIKSARLSSASQPSQIATVNSTWTGVGLQRKMRNKIKDEYVGKPTNEQIAACCLLILLGQAS